LERTPFVIKGKEQKGFELEKEKNTPRSWVMEDGQERPDVCRKTHGAGKKKKMKKKRLQTK